ncbi:hypothetical protein FQR65_LT06019 [Abscondita terminalis]|nr:hypothetical protein FQR65_LT06019 [Abscondita terminalis]
MSIRALPKNLQKLAETELNEVPDRVNEDVLKIREWLKYQPHLNARLDDQWLLSFLRGSKFSLEKTKQKIECYYTYRNLVPEFLQNRDPLLPEIQQILDQGCYWVPFPKDKSIEIPRVLYLSCDSIDSKDIHIANVMKVNFMVLDILMHEDDEFIISGHQLFINLKGTNMNHVMQITPGFVKKCVVCLRDAYPLRSKQTHLINVPNTIQTIVKPFFSGKFLQRIKIHDSSSFEELHRVLPKSILPKEFKGDAGTLQDLKDEWKRKIESYRIWFLNDQRYCSNESKRVGKPRTASDVFGIEGSFRKLEFD